LVGAVADFVPDAGAVGGFALDAQPQLIMLQASQEISARLSQLLSEGPMVTKVPKVVVDVFSTTAAQWSTVPRALSYSEFERLRAIYVGFFTTASDTGFLSMANRTAVLGNPRVTTLQSFWDNTPIEPSPVSHQELYDYLCESGPLKGSAVANALDFIYNFSFCSSFVGDLALSDPSWYCADAGMPLPMQAKNWILRGTNTAAANMDIVVVYEGQQTLVVTKDLGCQLLSPQ